MGTSPRKGVKGWARGHLGLLVVTVAFAAYMVYWSWFSITRYYDLYATYFDLGLFLSSMRQVMEGQNLLWYALDRPFLFLLSPLILFRSAPLMLVLQTLFIGGGALPLYGIARRHLGEGASAALSVAYLIYFPLAPANTFDLHMQAFFPLLFLAGYYFYESGKFWPSLVLIALSGTVRGAYEIFPALFSVLLIADLGFARVGPAAKRRHLFGFAALSPISEKRKAVLSFALLGLSACVLLAYYFIELRGPSSALGLIHVNSNPANVESVSSYLELYTLFALFFPLLLTPLLSRKWVLFYVPYLVALLYVGYWGYDFPFLQYVAGIAPFLFLGAIDGLSSLPKLVSPKKVVALILLALAFFDAFYEPYGPFFSPYSPRPPLISPYYNNNRDGVLVTSKPNAGAFNSLAEALSLVPPNATLSIENNMPEAYSKRVLWDPVNGQQEYALFDLHVSDQVPAVWLYKPYYGYGNLSAMEAANWLLAHGYGIYAELDGFVLMRKGYSGSPLRYSLLVEDLSPSQFWHSGPAPAGAPANLSWYGPYDELFTVRFSGLSYEVSPEWYGPYLALPPGKFKVAFLVRGVQGEVGAYVYADNGTSLINSTRVLMKAGGGWVNVTVTLGAFQGWMGLGISSGDLEEVTVTQLSPGKA